MAPKLLTIDFPIGGIDRTGAFHEQLSDEKVRTTPAAKNIFAVDPSSGRLRGGVRPVCKQIGSLAAPYHWCSASYIDSGGTLREGIAVCHSGGTNTSIDGSDWTAGTENPEITTDPGTTFASCAVFQGYLYQARSGGTCIQKILSAGTGETNLSNAGGGTAPTNCGLVWVHQGRLALTGKSDGPHQVFMSATGDATNWEYTVRSVGGAWANTGAEAGKIGHIVVAALNHNRDVSLIGSPRSTYAIAGNPKASGGGATRIVSSSIGPLMNSAWCKGIDVNGSNSTFMMTYDGLYMIPAGDYSEPLQVSRRKIPNELIGIDPTVGDRCCIGYDSRWPAIHIAVDYNSGSDANWVYYIPTDSWWQWELPITPHLMPTFPKAQTSARSAILPISSSGSVRQYDHGAVQGGAEEDFDSYVFIVIPLADPGSEGVLHSISAALAKDSENCNCQIFVGDSYEQAYDKALAGSSPDCTLSAWTYSTGQYWNYTQHPRVRGNTAILKVRDVGNEKWQLEQIVARVSAAGYRRVG
jgi:hypothetical protein